MIQERNAPIAAGLSIAVGFTGHEASHAAAFPARAPEDARAYRNAIWLLVGVAAFCVAQVYFII